MIEGLNSFLKDSRIIQYINENKTSKKFFFSINYYGNERRFKLYFSLPNNYYLQNFSKKLYSRIIHFYSLSNKNEIMTSVKQGSNDIFKYIHLKFNSGVKIFEPKLNNLFQPTYNGEYFQGLTVDSSDNINFRKYFYLNDIINKERLSVAYKTNFLKANLLEYTEFKDTSKVIVLDTSNYREIINQNNIVKQDVVKLEKFFNSSCSASGLYKENIISIYFCGKCCLEKLLFF